MNQAKRDSLMGVAVAFLIACIVIMFLGLVSSVADAGQIYCRQDVVRHGQYAQPLVAPVYYQIGAGVQQEAISTQQFRQSDEYIELQQLRGFKAGVESVTASGVRTAEPSQPATLPAATEGDLPTPPAAPPVAPTGPIDPFPTITAKCSKCHTGDDPGGGIWLDGTVALFGPDAATKRDAIVGAIRTGHMPPKQPEGHRLPPETMDAIEDELYGVQIVAEPTTPPEGE